MAAKEWGRYSLMVQRPFAIGAAAPSARSSGWVYALINPAMPGRVKMGCTGLPFM
jgi:hypothetical protein